MMDEVLGPASAMAFIAWIIWVITVTWRRSKVVKAQTQVRTQILEKINSGEEMLEFMKTEAGQKLLEPLPADPVEPAIPRVYGQVLKAVQAGIVLLALGVGIVACSESFGGAAETTALGGIVASIGVGFLLAGSASYMLSKNWKLINGEEVE